MVKISVSAGDTGSIPELGRWSEEGNGSSLQYSCLGNPMDREAWWATVYGVAKSQTQLSDWTQQILPVQNLSFLMTELALHLIFILWTILSSYIWELTSSKYVTLLKLWAFHILYSSQSSTCLGVVESWRPPALTSFATSGPAVVSLNICPLLSSGTPLCSAPKWSFSGHFAVLTPLGVSNLFLHFEMSLCLSLHVKSYSLLRQDSKVIPTCSMQLITSLCSLKVFA